MSIDNDDRKWALITGVNAGGLGDALAVELMTRGISVIATNMNLQDLDYLSIPSTAAPSVRLEKLVLDVASSPSIMSAVALASRITNHKLDILINNAGYGYMMPLLDAQMSALRQQFDVNVFGLLEVTQALSLMLRNARGMVVNQCSIAAYPGTYQPCIGPYEMSKSAVWKLSDVLRVELRPLGVKVVTLMTGDVATQFWNNAQGGRNGLPADSLYSPIRDKLETMMKGEARPQGEMSRQRWAKGVVDDLLRQNPPSHIRRGWLATMMWFVASFVPYWILDYAYTQAAGFGDLAKKVSREHDPKKTQ